MAAREYEFYLRVLKESPTSERSERVRDTLSTVEDKIRIPKRPCNILYLICIHLSFPHSSNKTNDDIVLDLVSDIFKYLPQRVDSTSDVMNAGQEDPRLRSLTSFPLKLMAQKTKSQDPLVDHPDRTAYITVLQQEINRFNRLLAIIHSSLSSLRLAVKGEVLMSEQLDEAFNALLSNRVPKTWEVREDGLLFELLSERAP